MDIQPYKHVSTIAVVSRKPKLKTRCIFKISTFASLIELVKLQKNEGNSGNSHVDSFQ